MREKERVGGGRDGEGEDEMVRIGDRVVERGAGGVSHLVERESKRGG